MSFTNANVTKRHENAYAAKKIFNDGQLLRKIPNHYRDYSVPSRLKSVPFNGEEPMDLAVPAFITGIVEKQKKGVPYTMVKAVDEDGTPFTVTYMHRKGVGAWIASFGGSKMLFRGAFTHSRIFGYSSFHAEFMRLEPSKFLVLPVYGKIKGVAEKMLLQHIDELVRAGEEDTLPERLRGDCPELNDALRMIHHPQNMAEPVEGLNRLILDDQIFFQAELQKITRNVPTRFCFEKSDDTFAMLDNLPFRLTGDQMNTVKAIIESTGKGNRVNALVQGDVGCGKTIVAFALMRCAAENGYQSVLMAPTQILAHQHYEEMQKLVPAEEIAFFDGQVKVKSRKEFHEGITSGRIKYIIGTSAILFQDLQFDNVGLSIVDEEHRFGVLQRESSIPEEAHTITMSATPIPRSLANAVYGDGTDVYQILEKPAGRKETQTFYDDGSKVHNFIYGSLKHGTQVYVVCPFKEEADEDALTAGLLSTEEIYEDFKSKYEPLGYKVACLTGNTKAKEKDEIIGKFKDGEYSILVSTTVIEVGVNVPSANSMVILNAERFGLATLHQLRGRIGRGNEQGMCVLVSPERNSRIDAMCSTSDGFKIAEADLEERRSGDLLGLKQSGKNLFVEELISHPEINRKAREIVSQMTDEEVQRHLEKYNQIYPKTE